jgi:hypothetical protein
LENQGSLVEFTPACEDILLNDSDADIDAAADNVTDVEEFEDGFEENDFEVDVVGNNSQTRNMEVDKFIKRFLIDRNLKKLS